MGYQQIWLNTGATTPSPFGPDDEPIKHPCHDPGSEVLGLTAGGRGAGDLGAVNVQDPTPVFLIENPQVWQAIMNNIGANDTVQDVLTRAVLALDATDPAS